MKETFYFRHDYNARNDERILELRSDFGWEGYGLYWAIIETIAENDNGGINSLAIGGLSIGLNYPKDSLKKLLEFCIKVGLFVNEDGFIHSKRFDEHLEFRGKLSTAGKDGAKKRWDNYREANGVAIATPMQSTVQESKVKGNKDIYAHQKSFYNNQLEISNEKEKYKLFIDILFGKNDLQKPLDSVLGLKDQVTSEQFSKLLLKKSDKKSFTFVLQNLENTKKYTKGKSSLYMIILNWFKTDFK